MALSNSKIDNSATKQSQTIIKESPSQFPLTRRNFIWMIVSGIAIVVGFLLMLGPGSTTEFNPDIFSFRRIILGPGLSFLGFVGMAIAIIIRPDK